MTPPLDRRSFVLGGLAGVGALSRPLRAASGRSSVSPGPQRTLVLIELEGGNDGLSTLVPWSDDAYARARSAARIEADESLRIDGRVGLHPNLTRVAELLDGGQLALIEGVGYPNPNRSHFRSRDIWHAADMRGRGVRAGWIGRCVQRLEEIQPHTVVHMGSSTPFSLYSPKHPPLGLEPGLLRVTSPGHSKARRAAAELAGPRAAESDALARLRLAMADAEASTRTVLAAIDRAFERGSYRSSDFGRQLRGAAALIHAEIGTRVLSIKLDGFDTHRDQRGRHDRLMLELDRGLGAFLEDLARSEAGREAVVLVYSEFGRRVEQNASRGTDHGKAGLAMALGSKVRGGLYGTPPSLEHLEEGDLAFTTDFRSLYAGCIEHVFELEPEEILGQRFPAVAFL